MRIQEFNQECCGCGACVDICPKKAICLKEDTETFLYPEVDKEICINCGLCDKACPLKFSGYMDHNAVKAFVGTYRAKDVIYNSSSGGAFTALYETYIAKGYAVYGAYYSTHLQVVHGKASTLEECQKFRKSKYIQSNTVGCFKSIEQDLKAGTKILFSGVSCQCAALQSYLLAKNIDLGNLITVNLLCHGVPSQRMFDTYIAEEAEKDMPIAYQFRNKEAVGNKINSRTAYVEFSSGDKSIRTIEDDAFLRGYYSRLFYRPSCAKCHFTCKERVSDFTIADAWNIEKIKPEYNPLEGVSLILCNTAKAMDAFKPITERMALEEVSADWAFTSQELFHAPTNMHRNRDRFFKLWRKMSFKKAVFTCTHPSLKQCIGRCVPKPIKNRIKNIVKR